MRKVATILDRGKRECGERSFTRRSECVLQKEKEEKKILRRFQEKDAVWVGLDLVLAHSLLVPCHFKSIEFASSGRVASVAM